MLRKIKLVYTIWRGMGELLRYISVALGICLVDQLFKHSIDSEPRENFPREMPRTRGKIYIDRAHNGGFTHGRFSEYPLLVKGISLLLCIVTSIWLSLLCIIRPHTRVGDKIGIMLVLAGALSNTYDRLKHGFVTDYLHVKMGFLRRSIINIADIAIVVGTFIKLIAQVIFG